MSGELAGLAFPPVFISRSRQGGIRRSFEVGGGAYSLRGKGEGEEQLVHHLRHTQSTLSEGSY